MNELQSLVEHLGQLVGDDPLTRGAMALGNGFLSLITLGLLLFRRSGSEGSGRAVVRVDAPQGEKVHISVGQDRMG